MKKICVLVILLIVSFGSTVRAQNYQNIKNIVATIKADSLMEYLSILSGAKSSIINGQNILISSRYRNSAGNKAAADFIKNKLSRFKSLKVSEQPLPDSGKNIIAVQTGSTNPKRQIILCAHYDSHLSGNNSPGADDDGTGTAALIEAARIFSTYSGTSTIVYAFFDREEEDLNGSGYYASQASQNKDSIIAVINLDMIGWDKSGTQDVEIDANPAIASSVQLANNMKIVNDQCSLGLFTTIVNIAKSNADNDSFWKYNFPAILLIELYGNENPYMHKTTDIVQNINKPFFEKCAKLGIATAARYADLTAFDGFSDVKEISLPVNFLEQNYPNPFNPATVISYQLSVSGYVSLKVYDILGREIASLVNEEKLSGNYEVKFDGTNFSSGIYFYNIQTGNFVQTRKMILIK